jgi:hypothetical protein
MEKTRELNALIQDFNASSGNFIGFYENMNDKEKEMLKEYLESLRVKNEEEIWVNLI